MIIHLIPNAHLDPVWLWDWREGLTEGLTTCRTILDLMNEEPELTFVRGEAAIYDHIERTDPATFERIRQRVAEGRWEIVGGVWVQPDTNLPATETFLRHLLRGQRYFLSRFGKRPTVAWAADSFGHTAGMPEIYAAAGMQGFCATRPPQEVLPLAKPAYWWVGPGGSRLLGYRPLVGWYGCERPEMPALLDKTLAAAESCAMENIGVWFGLGNHGGGPTRRQIADIRRWAAAHPKVKVIFSGLHRLIDAVYAEAAAKGDDFLPTYRGELNFVLRGCYASAAKVKFAYRRTEALVDCAQRSDAVIAAALRHKPADLTDAWDGVLFNTFHDILPGTSIERALDDQLDWMGASAHAARRTQFAAMTALAAAVDTRVPPPAGDAPSAVPLLVWNPHPFAYEGPLEMEVSLDYRPLMDYCRRSEQVPVEVIGPEGQALAFQAIATESYFLPDYPWRRRVLLPAKLPPMSWSVFSVGYREGAAEMPPPAAVRTHDNGIENEHYAIRAAVGDGAVYITHHGRSIFGERGLEALTLEDPFGSWGGNVLPPDAAEADDISTVRHRWTIRDVRVLEKGPYRATLWVRLAAGDSRLELTFGLCGGRDAIDVAARLLWNERSARLKLVLPAGDQADFEVPGAVVRRGPMGEVPGGKWVRVHGPAGALALVTDSLYGYDCKEGCLRATVARATRYASDLRQAANEEPWRPAVDRGELRFNFILTAGETDDAALNCLSAQLEQPPVVQTVTPGPGTWGRQGSLASLSPASLRLLAIKPAEDGDGLIVRVQQIGPQTAESALHWLGTKLELGNVPAWAICTWRLRQDSAGGWSAEAVDALERAVK